MNDFESHAKRLVDAITRKIDELLEKSNISKEEVKKEVEKRIEELKRGRDVIERELDNLKERNKDSIEKIEKFVQHTTQEVKDLFEDLFQTYNKKR